MGHVIAFVPASGGVGATTLAAATAVRAASAGRTAVIIDLDRLAGRLDVVLGVEQEPGWRWADLVDVAGVVDGVSLLAELPSTAGASVLAFDGGHGGGGGAEGGTGGGAEGEASAGAERGAGGRVGGSGGNGGNAGNGGGGYAGAGGCAGERLSQPDAWLERACDVVTGLRDAVDVLVLDCPRDERVLAALADQIDVVVVMVGATVAQVAAAAAVLPLLRAVLDGVRLGGCGARRGAEEETGGAGVGRSVALSSSASNVPFSSTVPPVEPWIVLRGHRVEEDLHDLVMDHLDVPVIGAVADDRRLVADLTVGRAPGTAARGPVVEMADRLLLRLVSLLDAA